MATKELQTRIALKYDSYAAWTDTSEENKGANLKLLPGEIGICEIPGTTTTVIENGKTINVRTAPTVLFKVGTAKKDENGNTELTPFKDLPWASAKAADVYSWAKASEVKLEDKKLTFVGGKETGGDLEIVFDYITSKEVEDITNRIDSLEAYLGSEDESGTGILSRITKVEDEIHAFFENAARDGADGVQDALDTLVEIQDYLNGDGAAAGSVIGRISAAEVAIEGLNKEFAAEGRVTAVEESLESLNTSNSGLTERVTAAEGEINAINAAQKECVKAKDDGLYVGEDIIYFNCGSATEVV